MRQKRRSSGSRLMVLGAISMACATTVVVELHPAIGAGVVVGGDFSMTDLLPASNSADYRQYGAQAGLYLDNGGIGSGWSALDAAQKSQIINVFHSAGPQSLELGYNSNPQAWADVYKRNFLPSGVNADEASINGSFTEGSANTAITGNLTQWEAYVNALRGLGISDVYPVYAPNSAYDMSLTNFATNPYFSVVRQEAIYGGGISVDAPVDYFSAEGASYRLLTEQEVQWAKSQGLNALWIVSPGDSGNSFLTEAQNQVSTLEAANAVPTQWVAENYSLPNSVNIIGSDTTANTVLSVADWLVQHEQAYLNPTWSGGGSTGSWRDSKNWVSGTTWANGATAEFAPPVTGQAAYQNDTVLDASGNFGAVIVDQGTPAITISGNPMQFVTTVAAVTNNSSNILTLNSEARFFLGVSNVDAQNGTIRFSTVTFRNDFNNPVNTYGFNVSLLTTGAGNIIFSGLVQDANGGTNGLVLNNGGAYDDFLTANTWTGGVDIINGMLLVSNGSNGSATGTGGIQFSGGGIAGNGTISGAVTMRANGTLTAGGNLDSTFTTFSNTPGTLALNGGLDMNAMTVKLNFDFAAASSSLLRVGNTLALSSNATVSINGTPAPGTYQIIDYSTLVNGGDINSWVVVGPSGFGYRLWNNTTTNSIDLSISAVPEPATAGLLALGGLALVLIRRKTNSR